MTQPLLIQLLLLQTLLLLRTNSLARTEKDERIPLDIVCPAVFLCLLSYIIITETYTLQKIQINSIQSFNWLIFHIVYIQSFMTRYSRIHKCLLFLSLLKQLSFNQLLQTERRSKLFCKIKPT